jgi:hypothetical protein
MLSDIANDSNQESSAPACLHASSYTGWSGITTKDSLFGQQQALEFEEREEWLQP